MNGGEIMFENMPDVVTIQEAADALRISRRSVKQLMEDQELAYRKIGRIYRIRKSSLLQYMGVDTEQTEPDRDTE